MLVSPVQPKKVFRGEAAVGLARLALITLAGLPILTVLALTGRIAADDVRTDCDADDMGRNTRGWG